MDLLRFAAIGSVGASTPYFSSRSLAGVQFSHMSFRFPAMVISLTG